MIIWCVEDDESIREIELYTLKSTGFDARGFSNSKDFWEAIKLASPDLIILDIMLPGQDGLEILSELKNNAKYSQIPVIMATAKDMEYDKIKGLDMGADDYLAKPFGMMEMVSRIKAVLRRSYSKTNKEDVSSKKPVVAGALTLDFDTHTLTVDKVKTPLTNKEFQLLALLLTHPGRVYTREQLFSSIWGYDYVGETRTIDMHIRTLRQKLGNYGIAVETVRNVGYRMDTDKL